jgi:hypothetical protein
MSTISTEMAYIAEPDIPVGMTIAEFRRTRTRTRGARRGPRIFKRR